MSQDPTTNRAQQNKMQWALLLAIPAGIVMLLLAIYFFSGSSVEDLDSVYGKRAGRGASGSVNGTRVLAEMFAKNGHKLRTLSRLSPGINERAEVIVWIPDSFEPPDKKQRDFLEGWLKQ